MKYTYFDVSIIHSLIDTRRELRQKYGDAPKQVHFHFLRLSLDCMRWDDDDENEYEQRW